MKFQHLTIGQKFLYQGQPYSKVSPLIGSHTKTGARKLIPRYAEVEPFPAPEAQTSSNPVLLNRTDMEQAFSRFQSECLASLDTLNGQVDDKTLADIRGRINQAGADFLRQLSTGS